MKKIITLLILANIFCLPLFSQTVVDVDPSLFLSDGTNVIVNTVYCTLSDGTQTTCYQIQTTSTPSDHNMGPWCPDNISDDASAGGIWLENGQVYDVDGAFIQNMSTFYGDNTWQMYDANGDIFRTLTEDDCANAANPNVGAEYENYCVECLPSYVADLTSTYCIPITPVEAATPYQYNSGGPGGGPPGSNNGPSQRGIAFNGVVFDAPAPTDAILGAYTLAPFDDAGGHINLAAGYHYHAATGVSTEIPQSDGHAGMIGYAMDGNGIYAELDENGNEYTDLDACRGHYDATRGYHYHVDNAGNNNFIDCLVGAYVADCGELVLPIELTSLSTTFDRSKVIIDWETASETNNDFYTIERSVDGKNFSKIAIIESQGSNSHNNRYTHNDWDYVKGISYYRLKQTDIDGRFSFSDIKVVKIETGLTDLIKIFPNPTVDFITIQIAESSSKDLEIEIWNILGELIETDLIGMSAFGYKVDFQNYESGTYFIKVKIGNDESIQKVVLNK